MVEDSRKWLRWLMIGAAASLVYHLVAVVFSAGFQNVDEHFQILEFLNFKLKHTSPTDLPIEYSRMIRPWLQPFLYWIPTKAMMAMGWKSPFVIAMADRLVSSVIGWISVVLLMFCVPIWIKDESWRKAAIVLLACSWYLPALHARHSSENLSGAVFAIALCLYVLARARAPERYPSASFLLLIGVLFGLSFEFRYQLAIMIAGALSWMVFVDRLSVKSVGVALAGIALAVLFGTCLDRVGYGQWVFAPWSYLQFNLSGNTTLTGGASPWWDYFRRVWTESWPFLTFAYLAGTLVCFVRQPKHVITWSLLPFFLAHVLIGHKEMRFLFPMAPWTPVALVIAFAVPGHEVKLEVLWRSLIFRASVYFLAAMNFVALLALSLTPPWIQVGFFNKVYDLYDAGNINTIYVLERSPYVKLGLPMHFYQPDRLRIRQMEDERQILTDVKKDSETRFWFARSRPDASLADAQCDAVVTAIPPWVLSFVGRWINLSGDWTLFSCVISRDPVSARESISEPNLHRH